MRTLRQIGKGHGEEVRRPQACGGVDKLGSGGHVRVDTGLGARRNCSGTGQGPLEVIMAILPPVQPRARQPMQPGKLAGRRRENCARVLCGYKASAGPVRTAAGTDEVIQQL